MCDDPFDYKWSSAGSRLLNLPYPVLSINSDWYSKLPTGNAYRDWLYDYKNEKETYLRSRLNKNLPCGSPEFIRNLEIETKRHLSLAKKGRPPILTGNNSDRPH